jgi:DNA-binding MarR family transcriptional regulator
MTTITIKKASLSRVLTAAHVAVAESAFAHGIKPIEMRVLMFIVDCDGERGEGVESVRIGEETGIAGSNVRRALYELHRAKLVEFMNRQRGQRLVATQTSLGLAVAHECRTRWEELVS